MKYSIIMPYHKKQTLYNTFLSYVHHYGARKDYEVLIMEDCKNILDQVEHSALLHIISYFSPTINIHRFETFFEDCYAPCRMFNEGARQARGVYLVLTNPECFHQSNILKGFDAELSKNPNAYVVAACYNTGDNKLVKKFGDFKPKREIWLQHSKVLNRGLHWCSVMSKAQYIKTGGFDEGYSKGFGREDVDFVRLVKAKGIRIIPRDYLVVVHMNHPDIPRKRELWMRNKRFYDKKWSGK